MNPQDDNSQDQSTTSGLLHDANFPSGIIKPRMLAADPTQAAGDLYYVNDSGIFQRLAAGTTSQTLTMTNGVPAWVTPTGGDGWISDSNTWTYSTVDGPIGVMTVNADLTGVLQAGDRIKITQTTAKKFILTKDPSYAAGVTTLTGYGGTDFTLANAAITSPYYSHERSPFGFNTSPAKWTETLRDTTDASAAPSTGVWTNLGSLSLSIPIGVWRVWYAVYVQGNTTVSPAISATLSTANNSESDVDLTSQMQATSGAALGFTAAKEKLLTLTSKTTYFLNAKYAGGTTTSLNFLGSTYLPTIVKAICAYL